MAIENINDLESAKINIDENGELSDLFVAIFKDNAMNFTKFGNLPIYTKYQIDKKIKTFEKEMTLKMQERNMVNKIYVKAEDSSSDDMIGSTNLVEHYLTLDQIADKLNNFAYKEIGVRYNISTVTGKHTQSTGKNVIRQGSTTLIAGPDLEPSALKPAFSRLDEQGNEISEENIFAREYYPWKDMKKVQISMDNNYYNYDMSIDNGGNYFTEVPLYYIDQRFIIEESYTVTGYDGSIHVRYKPIMDITSIWNAMDPLSCIPSKYQTEDYSIGMYKWVCEYPLYGYRPASFFIKKINDIPEVDSGYRDPSLPRYVKTEIGGEEYYILYKNYLEGNLITGEVPVLYCMVEGGTEYNTKILTDKHYFSCYEIGTETYNNQSYAVSKPGLHPTVKTNMDTFRTMLNNLGSEYFMQDMRGRTDFFGHLMDIEFATLDCQTICSGFNSGMYSSVYIIPLSQENITDNFICNYNVVIKLAPGQFISVGTALNSGDIIDRAIYQSSHPLTLNTDFVLNTDTIYYRTGLTDGLPTYSTSPIDAIDEYEYYLGNITSIGEIYVAKISTESELPTSVVSNISRLHQIYYNIENNRLYTPMSTASYGMLYKIYIDKILNTNFTEGNLVTNIPWVTGSTDILNSRNGTIGTTLNNSNYPFKWNWIENPYGNIWKFIDGIHITHNDNDEFATPHNTIWYCDIPELYNSDNNINYTKLTSYVAPGENGYCGQLGFDPVAPWVQITSKIDNRIYGDYYKQNVDSLFPNNNYYCLIAGGCLSDLSFSGLRNFNTVYGTNSPSILFGASIQKTGE